MGDGFFTSKGKGLPSKYGARKVRQAEKFHKSYGSRTNNPQNGCAIVLIAALSLVAGVIAAGVYGIVVVLT